MCVRERAPVLKGTVTVTAWVVYGGSQAAYGHVACCTLTPLHCQDIAHSFFSLLLLSSCGTKGVFILLDIEYNGEAWGPCQVSITLTICPVYRYQCE